MGVQGGWEVTWRGDGDPTPVATAHELDEILRPLLHERDGDLPLLAILSAPDGRWMGIGLDEPSVATFQDGVDPPYFVSLGSPSLGRSPFVYSLQGHWTEFAPEAAIPLDDALQALRAFFASGEQPTNIQWTEV
jgi:hypothetical protein